MEASLAQSSAIVDLLDRVLDKGLVISADIIVSVAGIPLIGVNLRAALAGMETMVEYGMMKEWDERTRQVAVVADVPVRHGMAGGGPGGPPLHSRMNQPDHRSGGRPVAVEKRDTRAFPGARRPPRPRTPALERAGYPMGERLFQQPLPVRHAGPDGRRGSPVRSRHQPNPVAADVPVRHGAG